MTADSSPLFSEVEAQQLVEHIQSVSGRWRPLMLAGLVLILAGFVVLTVLLNHRLAAAKHLADDQKVQIEALNDTLKSAGSIVTVVRQNGEYDEHWQALARLLNVADSSVTSLNSTIDNQIAQTPDAAPTTPPTKPTLPTTAAQTDHNDAQGNTKLTPGLLGTSTPTITRLFIHINSEDQRQAAQAVALAWSGRQLGPSSIVVPGIQLVDGRGDNSLRCTKVEACARIDTVLDWINHSLVSPKLQKRNLSRSYGNAPNVRPGTYEVWFKDAPIVSPEGSVP
jgi:hypothetical protein